MFQTETETVPINNNGLDDQRCENDVHLSENSSNHYTWKHIAFNPTLFPVDDSDWQIAERQFYTPLDYFNQYFDNSFFEIVADQSNRRALQANHSKLLKATGEEYKRLVGAHIVSGCMRLPRLRMYYRPSLRVPAITQIKRDRFFTLRNYMHFVDNLSVCAETKSKNRLWKIQPIIDIVRRKCMKIPLSKELSIDEQMIPFTGTTKLKQYVRGKPNPVGLKNFLLASADGMIHDFFIYQGANTWPDGKPNSKVGIGGSVVLKLADNIPRGHILYFDRYFTSLPLLEELMERDLTAVGTIQANRIPKNIFKKLSTDKDLVKKGRGSFDELVRHDEKVCIVKWMDNKSVLMASTAAGSNPVDTVKRWSKKDKKYVIVPRPFLVNAYNKSMGGVDTCDRLISYYRTSMRTVKWPVRVFWHFIDMAITNSWREYVRDKISIGEGKGNIMDLLHFRIYIGESLSSGADSNAHARSANYDSENEDEPPPKKCKKLPVPLPTPDVRKTGNLHLPICAVDDKNKFMRCRNKYCTGKTRFKCTKCDVFLCITPQRQCFMEFHT